MELEFASVTSNCKQLLLKSNLPNTAHANSKRTELLPARTNKCRNSFSAYCLEHLDSAKYYYFSLYFLVLAGVVSNICMLCTYYCMIFNIVYYCDYYCTNPATG